MQPLKIAIVAGEESGDLLGLDLIDAIAKHTGRPIELVGVGGRHLEARGLHSLFDASQIALMGVTAVLRDLPRLIGRLNQTARSIAAERPDCLITIDSPEFSLRVARKVRAILPDVPTVHYVCPSVWAWRPGRAAEMKPYVDHVLCLLPFEPAELQRLGGPDGTFVGHRLTRDAGLQQAAAAQMTRGEPSWGVKSLLLLPGSRRSEVKSLIGPFGETIRELAARGNRFEIDIATVPKVAALVHEAIAEWPVPTRVHVDANEKYAAFGRADAALAASGTVTLELALARVPLLACYKTDAFWRALMRYVTVWSASLPNLIADWPVVPEYYNEYVRPAFLARAIEQIWAATPARSTQLHGFDIIAQRLHTERPAGDIGAEAVLTTIAQRHRSWN
ncbi:lipid-A-disaccharide synthase [Aliihoeflea sp. PC F10.4]